MHALRCCSTANARSDGRPKNVPAAFAQRFNIGKFTLNEVLRTGVIS